jgi:hypothetical protein
LGVTSKRKKDLLTDSTTVDYLKLTVVDQPLTNWLFLKQKNNIIVNIFYISKEPHILRLHIMLFLKRKILLA